MALYPSFEFYLATFSKPGILLFHLKISLGFIALLSVLYDILFTIVFLLHNSIYFLSYLQHSVLLVCFVYR